MQKRKTNFTNFLTNQSTHFGGMHHFLLLNQFEFKNSYKFGKRKLNIRWTPYRFIKLYKVENILKGHLDSMPSPSPSAKNQIMDGKVCLRCKSKTLLGARCQQTFENKNITQQCFALLLQVNFPTNNWNFHWRWR